MANNVNLVNYFAPQANYSSSSESQAAELVHIPVSYVNPSNLTVIQHPQLVP